MRVLAFLFCLFLLTPTPARADAPCPPAGYDRAALDALKAADFHIASARQRNAFARAIAACVASPDPSLRDGTAFEALVRLLRRRELSDATMLALADDLEARLRAPDEAGFARPFAALILSEVARADRIEAFLTPPRRAKLLDASIAYFTAIRDYRGFDETEGWRHGVAHGADLLMQLALNEAIARDDLARIRDAAATQLAPEGHFYIYGEPERLARPILMIARHGVFSEAEWTAWFAEISGPGPLGAWDNAFASQAGLARRHDLTAFAAAIYLNAQLSDDVATKALLPGAEAAIRALP